MVSGVVSTKIFVSITILVVYCDYLSDFMALYEYFKNDYMMYFTIVLVGMFLERMMSLYMNLTTRLVKIKLRLIKILLTFNFNNSEICFE